MYESRKVYGDTKMTFTYRMKLFIILFVAAILLTFTISAIDYQRLKQQIVQDNGEQIDQATETVLYALDSLDGAYHYMDQETGLKMESYTNELQDKYKDNKDFSTWDFDELAEEYGMDIYILNDGNEIIYSNVVEEIGVDFSECCKSLSEILDERRQEGDIFIDGIDLDQQTGEAKKFSYMGTPDKKYLIELGYSLKNEPLFQTFNFLTVAEDIVENSSLIEDVHVLNYGGLPFGTTATENAPKDRRAAFEKARDTNEIVEVEQRYKEDIYTIRYVPYLSDYDASSTQTKVVEIIYSNQLLDNVMKGNFKSYVIQFIIALIVAGLVSFALAHVLAKPIHLAYYDTLTGLKNRASFDLDMKRIREKKLSSVALYFVDIDKFKSINVFLGRQKSDELLQSVANALQEIVQDEIGKVYHFSGDEFAITMPSMTEADIEYFATALLGQIESKLQEEDFADVEISISIGIALSSEQNQVENLIKQADTALYEAKKKGDNHYHVYRDE